MMSKIQDKPASAARFVQQLIWRDGDGTLTITPENESRFNIKLNRAIEILREAHKAEEFRSQFSVLLEVLAGWLKSQKAIHAAYVTLRDNSLCFVVVREKCQFDDEFEDSLSNLDMDIASDVDLDLIRLNTMALPLASEEAIASFLNADFTLQVVPGDARKSHPSRK